MEYDEKKVDDAVLALLALNEAESGSAWKSFAWSALDRLFSDGLITDPATKAKSVRLTEEGSRRGAEALARLFGL